ncbi:zinc-dependent alcohol dehydrogenase [Streptomyces niveus]|uniref:zinc-dependent alcohol dehydrogenase n=1 Tax=Streptomyces niveus TaxID=193462 RepID=UPI00368B7CAA
MRALVYLEPGSVELREHPAPRVGHDDDVVVNIVGTGICGTDRKILLGRFPARPGVVLGHESVGLVDEVGAGVRSLVPGDRVVVNPTLYCGWCVPCRRGATNFCRNKAGTEVGVDRDGTYADRVVLPERFVQRLPEDMPFRRAVLIEPLACVINNVQAASLTVDDNVAVLGAGPIGTLTAMVAARTARRVTVAEKDGYRLSEARRLFESVAEVSVVDVSGAEVSGADSAESVESAESVVKASGGERPSVVFETTGFALGAALGMVDDGGRIVVMGFDDSYSVPLSPLRLTNRGIRVIGAGDFRGDTFPVAVDLAAGLELERLVTHEFPLDAYDEALGALGGVGGSGDATAGRRYDAMKVVLRSDTRPSGADGWPVVA